MHTPNPRLQTNLKHGQWQSAEYSSWHHMLQRCTNPNHASYSYYGGRGITVDPRWRQFKNFLADMGKKPSRKHSIERIDNARGYTVDNCRWALPIDQLNNTRRNRQITWQGRTQSLTQWAREIGMKPVTLSTRFRLGWGVDDALTRPVKSMA